MCFRKQFLNKMWPIQFAFVLFIVRSSPRWFCVIVHVAHDLSNCSPSFPSTTFQNFPDISDTPSKLSKFQQHTKLCSKCSILLVSSLIIWCLSPILFNLPYQARSWRVWRLQNKKTSNSHDEIHRWPCATGKGRSGATGRDWKVYLKIGRCYGMVTNVKKKKDNRNINSTVASKFHDMSHTTAECGISQLSGNTINNAKCTCYIKFRITIAKATLYKKTLFTSKLDFLLEKHLNFSATFM